MRENIAPGSRLMTDGHPIYSRIGREFPSHETVDHAAGEYARGDVTTNTVEGYFGLLKRGLIGTYHHVGEQHLDRYLAEFDFRYNQRIRLGVDDSERTMQALKGIVGKRLTYGGPRSVAVS